MTDKVDKQMMQIEKDDRRFFFLSAKISLNLRYLSAYILNYYTVLKM
jgi:hypothetical protein